MSTYLVTWTSGFIWYHLASKLLWEWHEVIWIDNENDYYDVALKQEKRKLLCESPAFTFYKIDLMQADMLDTIFSNHSIDCVVNLAAQAGVRRSLKYPRKYIDTNLVWFFNIIDCVKRHTVDKLVYASSSSVYWMTEQQPSKESYFVDRPVSLYAATKKANELIAHSYSHLYGIKTIWLRFFTVYWPRWRPDMACFKFADLMRQWKSIDVYNHGKMQRDFTYIDDIVGGIVASIAYEWEVYEIFNLWNDTPEELEDMILYLEQWLWIQAEKNYMWMQPGDVVKSWADISHAKHHLQWAPTTSLKDWIKKFTDRYTAYYAVSTE